MINWMLKKASDPVIDDAIKNMMSSDYPDNPYVLVSAAQKLSPRAIVEAGIRAQTGKELQLPYGGPSNLSPWDKILLNPRQLFHLPTPDLNSITTKTIIGPSAGKPMTLDIPIMITGMSYGGSLCLKLKEALAKGAALAGTSTNTGESSLTNEERDAAKYIVGQYNRGTWFNTPDQLSKVDAIEVQLGQGAWGGGVESTIKYSEMDEHLRKSWNAQEGRDEKIHSRMPGVDSPDDVVALIGRLKSEYEVPVGIKIAGTDFIEYEMDVIAKTAADFITIDGAEGGTAVAPPTLSNDMGLPTLHSLVRVVDWLSGRGIREKFNVIATGGLTTPGHFIKAMALGADAVYIGSIAIMAAIQVQAVKAMPHTVPTQMALYNGKLSHLIDVDYAAYCLANFLRSCTAEMKLAVQAMGKQMLSEVNREDLVTVDKGLSEFASIRYAASHRSQ